MATTVTTAGRPAVEESSALTWLNGWIRSHKQLAAYVAVALLVALALFAWNFLSAKTAERSAGRQIAQGRLALDSKNYPLAASVLSQVVENFSGTHAAQEAGILLAQTRLAQGQTQQAIDVLQRPAPKADKYFRAQMYGLWRAAYENALRPRHAATAYESACAAPPSHSSSYSPSDTFRARISSRWALLVQNVIGSLARPHSASAHAAATAPVPHASVSSSTPRSYVRMRHSAARPVAEMKFTLAPAGPSAGSERSSRPRVTTSTRSTSPTSTTRCGTPTVPSTVLRSPGAIVNPGTGAGVPTGARCTSARSPSGLQQP